MNKDLKNIDKLFHHHLKGLQDIPPAHIWSGIEEALDSAPEKTVPTGTGQNRKTWFAAVVLLLLVAGIGTAITTNNASNKSGNNHHQMTIISHQDAKTITQIDPINENNQLIQQKKYPVQTVAPLIAMNNQALTGKTITNVPLSVNEPFTPGRFPLSAEPVQAIAAQEQVDINAIAPAPSLSLIHI